MKLRLNLEIETEGMTLLQFAALVDRIKHDTGARGRVECRLQRRDVDVSALLTEPASQ